MLFHVRQHQKRIELDFPALGIPLCHQLRERSVEYLKADADSVIQSSRVGMLVRTLRKSRKNQR